MEPQTPLSVVVASQVIFCLVQMFKVVALRGFVAPRWVEQWLPRLVATLGGAAIGLSGFLPGSPAAQIVEGLSASVAALAQWWALKRARFIQGEGTRKGRS